MLSLIRKVQMTDNLSISSVLRCPAQRGFTWRMQQCLHTAETGLDAEIFGLLAYVVAPVSQPAYESQQQ